MRRSSIVGPLILIAIGIVFLLPRIYPDVHIVDLLGRYWPFLLIGWGALRLVEVLTWAMTSKKLPSNGVSGGEWVLVVFICMIGWGSYKARTATWWRGIEVFGEAHDYPFDGQKTVGKTPRIIIESFRGDAKITGGDTEDVRVVGKKTIQTLQQSEADRANSETPFEISVSGDEVRIRTNQDRAPDRARVSATMEVIVPRGAKLIDAWGRRGDFEISDITGDINITSDNAGVRIQNVAGNVRVDTRRSDLVRAIGVKGWVELKGRGNDLELENIEGAVTATASYGGTIQLRALAKNVRFQGGPVEFAIERIPGQLRVTRSDVDGSKLVGPIRIDARSQDVQLNNFTQALELTVDRGHVELRPGGNPLPKIEVKAHRGDVDLALPESAKLELAVSTDSGDITNDFNPQFRAESQGRGETLRGSVGSGPRVIVSTGKGSITVRKSSGSDESVTFPGIPSTPEAPESPKPPTAPKALRRVEQ